MRGGGGGGDPCARRAESGHALPGSPAAWGRWSGSWPGRARGRPYSWRRGPRAALFPDE